LIIGLDNNQWEEIGELMVIIKLKWEIDKAINQLIVVFQNYKNFNNLFYIAYYY